MCGSNNLIKQDGVFVCQNCLTKYTVEEAKKIMIDGPIEIAGTVNIDTSKKENNLVVLVESQIKAENYKDAYETSMKLIETNSSIWQGWLYKAISLSHTSKKNDYQFNETMVCFDKAYELLKNDGNSDATRIIVNKLSDTVVYVFGKDCEKFVLDISQKSSDMLSENYEYFVRFASKLQERYEATSLDSYELENRLSEELLSYLKAAKKICDKFYQSSNKAEPIYRVWEKDNFIITTKTIAFLNYDLTVKLVKRAYEFLEEIINSQIEAQYFGYSSFFKDYSVKKRINRSTKKLLEESNEIMMSQKEGKIAKAKARENKYNLAK